MRKVPAERDSRKALIQRLLWHNDILNELIFIIRMGFGEAGLYWKERMIAHLLVPAAHTSVRFCAVWVEGENVGVGVPKRRSRVLCFI